MWLVPLLVMAVGVAAWDDDEDTPAPAPRQTTVELAATLGGEGPYTVFAPVNTAFDAFAPVPTDAVVAADVPASNGVIHVIDAVLLPPEG